ncbi:MAG: hypothetical protein EBZ77_17360, partial [Chitinophagia bacterium]|nr:hypothetical protein [Chitinophagia bacterium]
MTKILEYICAENWKNRTDHKILKPIPMTKEQQQQITGALQRYIRRFPSLEEAASRLNGVSVPLLHQVKNKMIPDLSAAAWRQVAAQVGFYCGDWRLADTCTHLLLRTLFTDARYHRRCCSITGGPGTGKTSAAFYYLKRHPGVCYLAATTAHNRRTFMEDLCIAAGATPGADLNETWHNCLTALTDPNAPLLLIDDAHKLKDRAFTALTDVVEHLYNRCGIVLMGQKQLAARFGHLEACRQLHLLLRNQQYTAPAPNSNDIRLICRINGLHE